jgi:hypothetical protein
MIESSNVVRALGVDRTGRHTMHDAMIRNVVDFAQHVRLYMRDSHVIVGSIVPVAQRRERSGAAFQIHPWGAKAALTVRFDDVARASPVRHMVWARQCSISAAQLAGIFASDPS